MIQKAYTDTFFQLLDETFAGPPPEGGSAYLDKGTGLFQTLDQVTAQAASIAIRPGAPTIAAHCEHLRFYVEALHAFMRGSTDKVDWKLSWLVQTVTTEEWNDLKGGLRRAHAELTQHLESVERWGDAEVGDGMAILVHSAYHLGAIRLLVRSIGQDS
jgi:hypothetical protein